MSPHHKPRWKILSSTLFRWRGCRNRRKMKLPIKITQRLNVGSMEPTSFLFWREKEYLPRSWSSYIKFYFARSLWCSGSALLPWVMTSRSNFSSSTLALQEGGEKPGHVFQGLSHVIPGTLLCSMCFISIDSVLLEVRNYSEVFIFVLSPVPTI